MRISGSPSAVTERYGKMCAASGIDSHLHALRHYSATELITAGVDLRTVAGRLGPAAEARRRTRLRGMGRGVRPPGASCLRCMKRPARE